MANHAVVVGCGRYEDPAIADLQYASRDAARFAERLRSVGGLPEDHVVLLSDDREERESQPTRPAVIRALADCESREIDILFFFFSGHGFSSASAEEEFLLPKDTVGQALDETALSYRFVTRLLKSAEPRHTVIFLDACRAVVSAAKAAQLPGSRRLSPAALAPEGMVSFHSCREGEASYEAPSAGGIFTAALCAGLSDDGKCKTIYELSTYLEREVPELSRRFARPKQTPFTVVQPLGIASLSIVSPTTSESWTGATSVGREIGPRRPPRPQREGVLCAVDFGTSFSAIGTCDEEGNPLIIPDEEGRKLIPSAVRFTPDLDYEVGWRAVEGGGSRDGLTIRHVKRRLGSPERFNVAGSSITPELVASLIVKSLRANAEQYLGCRVKEVVVSVPANFDFRRSRALVKAMNMADLTVARLITEPAIGSLLFDHSRATDRPVTEANGLVLDLGGGTFDVSTVNFSDGVVFVVGLAGADIGSVDYDDILASYLVQHLAARLGESRRPTEAEAAQIRVEAERAKVALTEADETVAMIRDVLTSEAQLIDVPVPISRDRLRELATSLTGRLTTALAGGFHHRLTTGQAWLGTEVDRASWDSVLSEEIDFVLLAGQGSRLFIVHELLASQGLSDRTVDDFREDAVIRGLCRQAAVLTGRERDLLLLDATPTTIAMRCADASIEEDRDGRLEVSRVTVSANAARNERTVDLVPACTTIPTIERLPLKLEGMPGEEVELALFERVELEGEAEPLASLYVKTQSDEVRLAVDIDADRVMVVTVTSVDGEEIGRLGLNDFLLQDEEEKQRGLGAPDGTRVSPDSATVSSGL